MKQSWTEALSLADRVGAVAAAQQLRLLIDNSTLAGVKHGSAKRAARSQRSLPLKTPD